MLTAFFTERWVAYLRLGLFAVVGLLALRNSPYRGRPVHLIVNFGLLISIAILAIGIAVGGNTPLAVASAWAGVLLLLSVVLLIRQILLMPDVTVQSIYGAISAYLVIGLMFAAFYAATFYLHSRTFFAHPNQSDGSLSDFQYFSFTTLTTLGYGDFTASTSDGRALAILEAITGQIFLATLVAKLVATFRPAPRRRMAAGAAGGQRGPRGARVPDDEGGRATDGDDGAGNEESGNQHGS